MLFADRSAQPNSLHSTDMVVGKTAEAIRQLNALSDEPDLELAVFTALKLAYSLESVVGEY